MNKKIISVTDLARKTKEILEISEREDFVVVKNNKPLFYAVAPENYSDIQITPMKKNEYLTRLFRQTFKDNVFFLMRFESPNITFPEVDYLMSYKDKTLYDFEADVTADLVEAWKNAIYSENKITAEYIIKLNSIIARHQALKVNTLRDGNVGVSGTNFKPEIPTLSKFKSDLDKLSALASIDFALEYIAYGIKSQLFWDGNKRTSILIANKILKQAGIGLLSIKDTNIKQFNMLLNNYYNDENTKIELIAFLKSCIYNTPDFKFNEIK